MRWGGVCVGAGICASIATHPLDVIRTRLAVEPELRGISHAVTSLWAEGRIKVMYKVRHVQAIYTNTQTDRQADRQTDRDRDRDRDRGRGRGRGREGERESARVREREELERGREWVAVCTSVRGNEVNKKGDVTEGRKR